MLKITDILFFVSILNIGTCLFDPPSWSTLRVKWGPIPFTDNTFAKMPLTAKDASRAGFSQLSSQCSGTFHGNRYQKGNDTTVILLYDVNGHIAGMQTAIPKSFAQNQEAAYKYSSSVVFEKDNINGQDVYVLTAYFVDPDIICTTGRSDADVRKQGTGSDLYLKNGTNILKIPKTQNDIANTPWTKGPCFISMGQHYWYNVSVDMSCQDFYPIFLMYNRGMLTGFGFVSFGKYTNTKHYEYPPKDMVKNFLSPIPKCVYSAYDTVGGVASMHVYFNVNPINLLC